jgi:hypothetical protein
MNGNIKVYAAINAVQSALVKEGIAKDRTCQQGGNFQYRGIDDVYNALAGLLSEAKLVILPRVLSHTYAERMSNAGKILFHSTVSVEYDFISAEDGSKHTVGPVPGEAMDSGDKSAGKAMSYAYKSMAFQTFSIPTEGDIDPDSQTHTVANAVKYPKGAPTETLSADDWKKIFNEECGKTVADIKSWRLKNGSRIFSTLKDGEGRVKLKKFLDEKEAEVVA